MDQISPELLQAILDSWAQVRVFSISLVQPWRLYQLGIILALGILAWLLRRVLAPRFDAWVRSHEGWPKWRYRLAVVIERRITLIIFAALCWITVFAMREITWPSRSYLIGLAGTLAFAWLVVAFAARLIRNRFLNRLVIWGGTFWVTAYLLGADETILTFLDSVAITFNDFRISALSVVKAAIVTGALFMGARILTRTAAQRIRTNKEISPSMQVLAIKAVQVTLFGGAFFIGLKAVGFDLTGLAVLSGAIGVGLGFGLQKVVSNLVSGIIILLDKSIKPGDVISIGDTFGWIGSLGARYVSVVTRDGKEFLIPNEDLITGQVVNWSHTNDYVRIDLNFGTSYGDDPHLVRRVAIEAAGSVSRVLSEKAPVCHIIGFGDSSVDYTLRFWIRDPTEGLANIRGNVYLALWDAFQKHRISIPFPQRELRMLKEAPDITEAQTG
ncbi:MAG: mechanosensitive ion channel family protein [Pseudorhodobacter sp.]